MPLADIFNQMSLLLDIEEQETAMCPQDTT
jgi:hypothetical protein